MDKMVITIARSYGSGGRTLGKKLAEEYGIKSYDREIIRMASDDSGISEALFGEADESMRRVPIFKSAGANSDGEVYPPQDPRFTSPENLFRYQAKVIRKLAETESCIIIGRCADYILRDYDNVAKLFFYASEENCITRVINQKKVSSREEAIDRIAKIDRYRANYYKYFTGRDWDNVANYDFCIDTASMDYDKLIRVVKAYLAER